MSVNYLLYANCVPVRGYKHHIICDLQRNSYVRIPSGLYEILTQHRGKSLADIKAAYDHQYDDIIDNYFATLVKNEFAFACPDPSLFPPLSLEWKTPFAVYNGIVDRDHGSTYDLRDAISQFSRLHCKYLQLRFFDRVTPEELTEILDYFETIRASVVGLEIIAPGSPALDVVRAKDLLTTYQRLNKLVLHGCATPFSIDEVSSRCFLICMPEYIDGESHCGAVSPALFSINTKSFSEARHFNSCLNGKLSIDRRGYIRNCPSMPKDYGNIRSERLATAVRHPDFRALWKITKDEVEVCRDCEFRYICTDCRAYTVDDRRLGKPRKCGYDPYTGEWEAAAAPDFTQRPQPTTARTQ